jgi:hypothetical protein
MQNKWFVGGMMLPALVCAGIAVGCAAKQQWLLGAVPAVIAAGLFRGAWWAWHADAFASVERRQMGDVGTSVAVARWHQHCDERDAAAAKAAAAPKSAAAPPKT